MLYARAEDRKARRILTICIMKEEQRSIDKVGVPYLKDRKRHEAIFCPRRIETLVDWNVVQHDTCTAQLIRRSGVPLQAANG
jgi:hypothetical protein